MKKINRITFDKDWGHEVWLYSAIPGKETHFTDGTKPTEGPVVKLIYTHDKTSIKVNPDDVMADKVEHAANGRSESWYVLKSGEDSSLFLGLKTNSPEEIEKHIDEGKFEKLLKEIKVEKHHMYNVPAGLVQGIGKNLVILNVQEISEVEPYRLHDFDRVHANGRVKPLNIKKAVKAQKEVSARIAPIEAQGCFIYKNSVATQIFGKGEMIATSKGLFINLDTLETWFLEKGEKMTARKYLFIPIGVNELH